MWALFVKNFAKVMFWRIPCARKKVEAIFRKIASNFFRAGAGPSPGPEAEAGTRAKVFKN